MRLFRSHLEFAWLVLAGSCAGVTPRYELIAGLGPKRIV